MLRYYRTCTVEGVGLQHVKRKWVELYPNGQKCSLRKTFVEGCRDECAKNQANKAQYVDLCKVRQGYNNNNMPNPCPDVSSFGLLLVHPCLTLLHLLFA